MIFSKQKCDKAFTYMSKYYNKILFVNLDDDTYEPIKVNDNEWQRLTYSENRSFSEWVGNFFEGPFYSSKPGEESYIIDSVFTLRNLDKLKKVDSPITMDYKKVIDGFFHDVMLEYLPIGNNRAYLFVKDLYLMQKGIYDHEN